MDGLEAVKWCYVWAGYADDDQAGEWVAIFAKKARARPTQLPMIKSLYEAASWKFALAMRSGKGFHLAVCEIREDTAWMRDYMEEYRPPRQYDQGYGAQSSAQGGARAFKGAALFALLEQVKVALGQTVPAAYLAKIRLPATRRRQPRLAQGFPIYADRRGSIQRPALGFKLLDTYQGWQRYLQKIQVCRMCWPRTLSQQRSR